MSTTSNIKISQLTELGEIADGRKLKIPVSKYSNTSGNPNWESYGLTANVLSSFLEKSLGISGSPDSIKNVLDFTRLMTIDIVKALGKYDTTQSIEINGQEEGKYLTISGTKKDASGCMITTPIRLKQGNLYLLDASYYVELLSDITDDISIMSKVSTREYTSGSGTSTEITYEHLPTHYISSDGGLSHYAVPHSNYFVFFATEDIDVVISCPDNLIDITEVQYGTFVEIADKLLTINGELMKVLVEAIVKNKKDIDSLYEKTKSLGDIHVTSIDSDEFPSVQGEPMVVVADRAPDEGDNKTRGADVPNRIGQIWVNTKDGLAYIAVSLGFEGWKQITNPNS